MRDSQRSGGTVEVRDHRDGYMQEDGSRKYMQEDGGRRQEEETAIERQREN